MPILPAFYRHLRTHHLSPKSSPRGSPNLSKRITNSFLSQRRGGGGGGGGSGNASASKKAPDPYPLYSTRGYEELEEMEAGKGLGGIVRGTEVSVVVEDRGGKGVSR